MQLIEKIKQRAKIFLKLNRHAKKLKNFCRFNNNFHEIFDYLMTISLFSPSQNECEIRYLINLIQENNLLTVCEIGSKKGGTLFLFCQAVGSGGRIISVDIDYPLERKIIHSNFAKKGQKVICIKADSQNLNTAAKLKKALFGRKIDLLFIDGDHSFFGVTNDFILYSPLVREGGYIAFHDIHPDYRMQKRILTNAYVGEVPFFWESIKKAGYETEEIVEDPNQDGKGIGIIFKQT